MVDVSDAAAVEAFAEQVCATHGVPDIVVNNAGIGVAGAFLDTPAEQFDRVLDVNLGETVNGCRSFARRLVDRGAGGHIVNVASMAAYAPLSSLNAYCTSRGGGLHVLRLLRAELDAAGIGLTTICPGVVNTNIVSATGSMPQNCNSAVAKPARATGADVRVARLPAGEGRCRHPVGGAQEQADPPGDAGGLSAVRNLADTAAGALHRSRESGLVTSVHWFAASPLLTLFVCIGLGGVFGRIRFGPVSFGPAGALFVALALSAIEPKAALPPIVTTLSLCVFCYMVGIAAGPAFIGAIRTDWRPVVVSLTAILAMAGAGPADRPAVRVRHRHHRRRLLRGRHRDGGTRRGPGAVGRWGSDPSAAGHRIRRRLPRSPSC